MNESYYPGSIDSLDENRKNDVVGLVAVPIVDTEKSQEKKVLLDVSGNTILDAINIAECRDKLITSYVMAKETKESQEILSIPSADASVIFSVFYHASSPAKLAISLQDRSAEQLGAFEFVLGEKGVEMTHRVMYPRAKDSSISGTQFLSKAEYFLEYCKELGLIDFKRISLKASQKSVIKWAHIKNEYKIIDNNVGLDQWLMNTEEDLPEGWSEARLKVIAADGTVFRDLPNTIIKSENVKDGEVLVTGQEAEALFKSGQILRVELEKIL